MVTECSRRFVFAAGWHMQPEMMKYFISLKLDVNLANPKAQVSSVAVVLLLVFAPAFTPSHSI